jgi:hypothetical protein
VVVGSTLDLTVTGHACNAVRVVDARSSDVATVPAGRPGSNARGGARTGGTNAEPVSAKHTAPATLSTNVLLVNTAVSHGVYSDYAHIQVLPSPTVTGSARNNSQGGDEGTLALSLRTVKPGVMSLHLSARVLVDEAGSAGDGAAARYRRRGCRIRVVIIPNYPVESVLLQELIGHLEECRKWRNPKILLHAQLFQRPQSSEEDHSAAKSTHTALAAEGSTVASARAKQAWVVNARDVQRGWQDIKRVITNHGVLHTPKVA